ncbi:DUF1294 domain-containing protein [Cellvibrio mixtus]|uniref:DUF1294 domain-containing protein n=1 Tax=Cellvibrio mixtus TaxID=39650 RepID=UPI0005867039|nr:cold shock and DUF1294 domain-containing protein [Cellvibrio mixtus]
MSEQSGVIDSWDDQKGFGFISISPGKKVFFHISAVRGLHRPIQGDSVFFQLGTDKQGRTIATHVRSTNLTLDNPRIRVKPRVGNKEEHNHAIKKRASGKNYRLFEHEIPWVKLVMLLVLPFAGALNVTIQYGSLWIFPIYLITSLLAYYFYWDDKRRAKRNEWRITEANLQFWSLIGGWPGAFIAQQQFRHKTKKLSFQMVFWLIVIAHQLLWFDWLFLDGRWLMASLSFGN